MSSEFTDSSRNTQDDIKLSGQISLYNYNIPYKLMEGFPKITWSDDGVQATEEILIRVSDCWRFLDESLPGPDNVLHNNPLPLRRTMPGSRWRTRSMTFGPYPEDKPWDPYGNHSTATNDNISASAPTGTYATYCKVIIDYRLSRESSDPDEGGQSPDDPVTYTDHSVTVGGQALTISPDGLRLMKADVEAGALGQDADGNVALTDDESEALRDALAPVVKIAPTLEHTLTLDNRVNPPWEDLIDTMGKVNKAGSTYNSNKDFFGFGKFTAKGETVLFMGFSATKKVTTFVVDPDAGTTKSQTLWDLSLRFSQRTVKEGNIVRGWNHIWDGRHQKWLLALRKLENDNTKKKPLYETANFDVLLKDAE